MKKLVVLLAVLFLFQAPFSYAQSGPCPRKVAVRTSSETDPSFNAAVFLEHFRSIFQSSSVELGEDFENPEYVLAATFEKDREDPPRTYLGIILGFVGGEFGRGASRGTPYFPHITSYDGDLIDSAWTLAPGNSVSNHVRLMAAEFASKGGLEKLMHEFEQIPIKAEAELVKKFFADDTCAENGEEREISVIKLESPYPETSPYLKGIRLVAQVEKGEILNGEPISGNDKYRAYSLQGWSRGPLRYLSVRYRAPSEGDSDKLIVYNSCDILHERIKPLKDTVKKDVILTFDIPVCYAWEGTIEHRWAAKSAKGESLLTTILPGGEYQSTENWRLRVKFKKDRGNEDVQVFSLMSARLELFEEKLDATVMDMSKEDRSIRVEMKDSATARYRTLSPKECALELALNRKRGTYILSGGLHVKGIPSTSQSKMEMIKAPIDQKERDSGRGTVEINQSIELSGSLAPDAQENIRGTKDVMQDLAPDAKKFLKDMGGEQTSVFRWDLVKRKEKISR